MGGGCLFLKKRGKFMTENPYSWDTATLLSKFMDACGRAGFSNCGLVISPTADNDLADAHYLRGVVLARIDQVKPPFVAGDRVGAKSLLVKPVSVMHWRLDGSQRHLPHQLTVAKVIYCGSSRWQVLFREKTEQTASQEWDEDGHRYWNPLLFHAEDFELSPALAATV